MPTDIGTRDHVVEQLDRAERAHNVSDAERMRLHLGIAIVSALLAIGDDIEGLWKGDRS